MHARVSFYEGSAGVDFDSGVQAFQTAVSSVGEMDGNQGATLLIDRNSGKAITITYWDTEEQLQASVEAANQIRQQAADAGGLSIRAVEHYEVAMDEGR
jgi:heme-degrading monooxygenase HmoA